MTDYYKAIRPDGTDFRTATVQWAPPEGHGGEWIVRHPTAQTIGPDPSDYLSVSTDPTDLPGTQWPMRLLTVEPVGATGTDPKFPHKVTGVAFRVTGEVEAHQRFGPMGEHVEALIDRALRLTVTEVKELGAAGDAAWYAAWYAARDAAGDAARDAAWYAARGLVVRDIIGQHGFTQAHYDVLTGPWRKVIGPIHPDDAEVSA